MPDRVGEPPLREAGAELGALPYSASASTQPKRPPEARTRSISSSATRHFGPVGDRLGHPYAGAPLGVGAPVLGQEQPQADADRHLGPGQGERDQAWQLARLPSWPQYWRLTPTERRPCFTSAVSSTTSTASGPAHQPVGGLHQLVLQRRRRPR
jgi:hypothetical protein